MKKAISIFTATVLMLTLCSGATGVIHAEKSDSDKMISNATLNDSFADDSVVVVIKKKHSDVKGDINNFKLDRIANVKEVRNLTEITNVEDNEYFNAEKFQQILHLTLKETGKEKVLKAVKELEKLDFVESVEPDYNMTPDESTATPEASANDPSFGNQYALSKISAPAAWDITTGVQAVKVGIIDSGIYNHDDLRDNLSVGKNFTDSSSSTNDTHGHGTKVAGVVGAVGNNGKGISGVNWRCSLVPLKINFSSSQIASALTYCANEEIPIVNMSFGGTSLSNSEQTAMSNYGGLMVCSAGNAGANNDVTSHYPSNSTLENVIAVTATNSLDAWVVYNGTVAYNYGINSVDLAAPGRDILTTTNGNGYALTGGTSLAAPYVAGVAAMIKGIRPDLSSVEIKNCILNGVDKIAAFSDKVKTGGRLNAYKAVQNALNYIKDDVLTGDFNGDNKDDLLLLQDYTNGNLRFNVKLHNNSAFNSWYNDPGLYKSDIQNRIAVGDFNGDGKDDVAVMYDAKNSNTWYLVYLSTGTGFRPSQTWRTASQYTAGNVADRFVAGDFNGDGKDDLAAMYYYGSSKTGIHITTSTGSSFNSFSTWYYSDGGYTADSVTGRFASGDFDGDGKDDIVTMYNYHNGRTGVHVFLSKGTYLASFQSWFENTYVATSVADRFTVGDFNGDNKDDVAVLYQFTNESDFHIFTSTGSRFNPYQAWRSEPKQGFPLEFVDNFIAADVNGDGKSDIITKFNYNYRLPSLLYFPSNGSSLGEPGRIKLF